MQGLGYKVGHDKLQFQFIYGSEEKKKVKKQKMNKHIPQFI